MVRDRVYLLLGSCLSLAAAIAMLFTMYRLADTCAVSIESSLADGLLTSLTVVVGATCLSGLGMCLTSYGLAIAARHRSLTTPTKRAAFVGGLVFTLAGVLMFITFRDLLSGIDALREAGQLRSAAMLNLADNASTRIISTFCAFLSAEMLTIIAVTNLFWGDALPKPRRALRVSLLSALLASTIGFVITVLLATRFGWNAALLAATESADGLLAMDSSLRWEAKLMILAGASLAVFGIFRTVQAVLFPVKDHS